MIRTKQAFVTKRLLLEIFMGNITFSPIVITLFQEFSEIVKIDQDLRSKKC